MPPFWHTLTKQVTTLLALCSVPMSTQARAISIGPTHHVPGDAHSPFAQRSSVEGDWVTAGNMVEVTEPLASDELGVCA